jgi:hypothetical protein
MLELWVIAALACVGAATGCGGESVAGDPVPVDEHPVPVDEQSSGGSLASPPSGQGGRQGAPLPSSGGTGNGTHSGGMVQGPSTGGTGTGAAGGVGLGARGGRDAVPSWGGTGAQGGIAGSTGEAGVGHSGAPPSNGSGGTTMTGAGGEGGEPSCGPESYVALGGHRCESTESYAQGPNYERVGGATTREECLEVCAARPDCSAVSDYLMLDPFQGCYLDTSSCETFSKPLYAEEDGGRTHQKVCDETGCRFEAIPGNYGCGDENEWGGGTRLVDAASLDDCKAACLASPTCQSVNDYFYLRAVPGCYLNTSTCEAPVSNFQDGSLLVKNCR